MFAWALTTTARRDEVWTFLGVALTNERAVMACILSFICVYMTKKCVGWEKRGFTAERGQSARHSIEDKAARVRLFLREVSSEEDRPFLVNDLFPSATITTCPNPRRPPRFPECTGVAPPAEGDLGRDVPRSEGRIRA